MDNFYFLVYVQILLPCMNCMDRFLFHYAVGGREHQGRERTWREATTMGEREDNKLGEREDNKCSLTDFSLSSILDPSMGEASKF